MEKKKYEEPVVEIVDLTFEDSIAASIGASTALWEEIW